MKKQNEQCKLILSEEVKILERESSSSIRNLVTANELNVMGGQIKKELLDEVKKVREGMEGI